MNALIYRNGCPLCDAIQRMGIYDDDCDWWQARIDAWKACLPGERPPHCANDLGWKRADDDAGLWLRQRAYAEEQAKAIGAASQGHCAPAINSQEPQALKEAA